MEVKEVAVVEAVRITSNPTIKLMKRFIHLVEVEEAISQDQHVEADQAIVMSQPKPTLLKSKMITHMMIRLKFK